MPVPPKDPTVDRFNVGPGGSLDLENVFSYHAPFGDQVDRYGEIRDEGWNLARMIEQHCPPSPERSTALTKVREAVMWANAAIACHEKPPVEEGPVHWLENEAMIHAVPDVAYAQATADPDKVTCKICKQHLKDDPMPTDSHILEA